LQRLAAVDQPVDTRHMFGIVGRKKGDSSGNILGLADAAQGNAGGKALDAAE